MPSEHKNYQVISGLQAAAKFELEMLQHKNKFDSLEGLFHQFHSKYDLYSSFIYRTEEMIENVVKAYELMSDSNLTLKSQKDYTFQWFVNEDKEGMRKSIVGAILSKKYDIKLSKESNLVLVTAAGFKNHRFQSYPADFYQLGRQISEEESKKIFEIDYFTKERKSFNEEEKQREKVIKSNKDTLLELLKEESKEKVAA